jgi:hypothetical protein
MTPATALKIFSEQGPLTKRSANHTGTRVNASHMITGYMTDTERIKIGAAWARREDDDHVSFRSLVADFKARLVAEGIL